MRSHDTDIFRRLAFLFVFPIVFASCGGGGDGGVVQPPGTTPTVVTKFAALDNTQEVPPTISAAKGGGILAFDSVTRGISGFVVTSGIGTRGNNAHIHVGARGAAPPQNVIVQMFSADGEHWFLKDGEVLPAANVADFNAGNLYYNVHTPAPGGFPGGEIRGQIDLP